MFNYSENAKSVPLPLLQFVVICCNLFCFYVAITDLSTNTAIKFKFRTFYAMHETNKNVLFPFATNYHILKKEKTDPRLISEITSFFFKKRPEIITFN